MKAADSFKLGNYFTSLANSENHIPLDSLDLSERAQREFDIDIKPSALGRLAIQLGFTLTRRRRAPSATSDLEARVTLLENWVAANFGDEKNEDAVVADGS